MTNALFQIFMKRVRKALNRHDLSDARRMYEQQKPVYTLDHVLKERYPRFEDALCDLDDALSMLALFAALPAEGTVRPERTAAAARLMREWLYYVARSHALVRARACGVELTGVHGSNSPFLLCSARCSSR